MKAVFKFMDDHSIITMVYSFYFALWIWLAMISYRFYQTPPEHRLYVGEALGLGYFLLIRLSAVYLLFTFLQALFLKRLRLFYLKLCLSIIIPAAIMTVIGFW